MGHCALQILKFCTILQNFTKIVQIYRFMRLWFLYLASLESSLRRDTDKIKYSRVLLKILKCANIFMVMNFFFTNFRWVALYAQLCYLWVPLSFCLVESWLFEDRKLALALFWNCQALQLSAPDTSDEWMNEFVILMISFPGSTNQMLWHLVKLIIFSCGCV